MKFLLICREKNSAWLTEKLGHHSDGFMLPIANKPVIEFYFDLCSQAGIDEVRIVTDDPDLKLEKYAGDGGRWGLECSFSLIKSEDELKDIVAKNHKFLAASRAFIVSGLFFPKYKPSDAENINKVADNGQIICNENGEIFLIDDCKIETGVIDKFPCEFISLNSFDKYFELCRSVMTESSNYILPGYNNDPEIYIGRNVVIPPDVELKAPVVIGDFVQLSSGNIIGPNVQVGNHVLVDEDTEVADSIIGDFTYLGRALDFNYKIVFNKKLIDPVNDCVIDDIEEFIISRVQEVDIDQGINTAIGWVIALLLTGVMFIPYVIMTLFEKVFNLDFVVENYLGKDEKLVNIQKINKQRVTLIEGLFLRFSLDKFRALLAVLSGKLNLVGDLAIRPIDKRGYDLDKYQPGAFCFSELVANDGDAIDSKVHNIYYRFNRSVFGDVKIVCGAISRRVLYGFNRK